MTRTLLISLSLICVMFCVQSQAQPELDTNFSSDGKLVFTSGFHSARDVIVQADNKIVMVSGCATISGISGSCLLRLNENGTSDSTFGTNGSGLVFNSVGTDSTGVARQIDGKLITVGGGGGPSSDERSTIVRYNPNGTLDGTFGNGGVVLENVVVGLDDRATKVAVQPDGKIVLVGYSGDLSANTRRDGFVVRFLPNGALDSSFAAGGVYRITSLAGDESYAHSIVIQPDGKILAGGALRTTSPTVTASYFVLRLDSNGMPDATWDNDGIRIVLFGTFTFPDGGIRGLALQSDGKVLAVGHTNVLYRFNSDGSDDMGFDGDGSRTALNHPAPEPHDVIVAAGGRIVVVGERQYLDSPGTVPYLYLTSRYLADGSPDLSYSDDGYLEIEIGTNDGAWAAASDSLGRIVVAGRTAGGTTQSPWENSQFSVVRLMAPVAPVGISGRVTGPDGRGVYGAVLTAVDTNGFALTSRSNPFGYYSFSNVLTGFSYTISVHSKRYVFSDRSVVPNDNVTGFDFVGENPPFGTSK